MLIRNATLRDGRRVDVRLHGGVIAEMARSLPVRDDCTVIEADGGVLLPGLHDHHIHLMALAASFESVACGPPLDAAGLVARLRTASPADGWVRGIDYHESVAGEIDRVWLDAALPDCPVRVQHRSGRLWVFNSAGLARLGAAGSDSPFERNADGLTGRLYDADEWLRAPLGRAAPSLSAVSKMLARRGVTAVSDATAANDEGAFEIFRRAREEKALAQHVAVMGDASLVPRLNVPGCAVLARKIHLHEGDYPDPEAFLGALRQARAHGLQFAVHCVTEADLVFTLSLFEEAGAWAGYRIEHASLAPPALLARIEAVGATVVTQHHFLAERGDAYCRDVPMVEQDWLYRGATFLRHGVKLAGGTDAPFGHWDPWRAMQAAVMRRTSGGAVLGADEVLTPEQALDLFTTHWAAPGGPVRRVQVGAAADLCVLRQNWAKARMALRDVEVAATIQDGALIHHDRVPRRPALAPAA